MSSQCVFKFKSEISNIEIPNELNNPFTVSVPRIISIATSEFQDFITEESKKWDYDFTVRNGKMFGVLVIQNEDDSYGYLGTVSGKISKNSTCENFVPSVFDESTDDYFINRGMAELTAIGDVIKKTKSLAEVNELKQVRSSKSKALQQRLFENYSFYNSRGVVKNVLEIFEESASGKPPAAAGECAAPKLLNFAFQNNLKPVALAEFWWGNPLKNDDRKHKEYYPACKNKCRPILEYMLSNLELYINANKAL